MTKKKIARPDLQIPVEAWGTITGATDKLQWLERGDACIAAGMVPRSFLHVAVRIATQWLNKETGLTWRSAENVASDIGMAKSSVEGLLEAAVAAGLLIIVKRGQRGRGKRSTIYRPAMPDVLIPGGPGFKPGALIPDGPGFKRSRKSRLGQRANPGFGPNIIPAHRDDLPEEVIPEDIIPVAAEGGADTARGDSSNTTRVVRESDNSTEPSRPNQRAPEGALIDTVAAKSQPPFETSIGATVTNGADHSGFGRIRMEFERLTREYPQHHVGDKAAALLAFDAAVRKRGVTRVGIEITTMLERGGDVPDLAEALLTIERNPPTRHRRTSDD
jgi:hypothetical protein